MKIFPLNNAFINVMRVTIMNFVTRVENKNAKVDSIKKDNHRHEMNQNI